MPSAALMNRSIMCTPRYASLSTRPRRLRVSRLPCLHAYGCAILHSPMAPMPGAWGIEPVAQGAIDIGALPTDAARAEGLRRRGRWTWSEAAGNEGSENARCLVLPLLDLGKDGLAMVRYSHGHHGWVAGTAGRARSDDVCASCRPSWRAYRPPGLLSTIAPGSTIYSRMVRPEKYREPPDRRFYPTLKFARAQPLNARHIGTSTNTSPTATPLRQATSK